jgi:hypothetical protein
MFQKLTEENFLLYAIKNYDNPSCKGLPEFYEDLNRIKYIKRLFNRFETKKILKDRLILNHLIILNNIFGTEAAARILFYKVEPKFHSYLKSFLLYLNFLPNSIFDVNLDKIPVDHRIINILKKNYDGPIF